MAAIKHQLTLLATPEKVYEMIATSKGLDLWWTLKSSGTFNLDANVTLGFWARLCLGSNYYKIRS